MCSFFSAHFLYNFLDPGNNNIIVLLLFQDLSNVFYDSTKTRFTFTILLLKLVLLKMATGIKTLKRISRPFPEKTRLLLLNALVISHLHYSALLLASSKNNCFITLEKQLSWAVKTCFNRKVRQFF